jgi:hypothetical protein
MMAKLFAIVTGLGVLVDREDPSSPSMVLLRRVLNGAEPVGRQREIVPPHEPLLRLKPDGVPIQIGGREVEIVAGAAGRSQIERKELLLPVGPELRKASRIHPDFLGDAVLREGSKVILASGTIEPVHIDDNDSLANLSFNVGVFLDRMFDPDSEGSVDRDGEPVANGLLYSLDLGASRDAPVVRIGSERFTLTSVPREQLGGFRDRGEELNYVVWIVNVASEGSIDPQLARDIDFYLLYDWLAEEVNARFIPETRRERRTGQGNPPGQCMYGVVRG